MFFLNVALKQKGKLIVTMTFFFKSNKSDGQEKWKTFCVCCRYKWNNTFKQIPFGTTAHKKLKVMFLE